MILPVSLTHDFLLYVEQAWVDLAGLTAFVSPVAFSIDVSEIPGVFEAFLMAENCFLDDAE